MSLTAAESPLEREPELELMTDTLSGIGSSGGKVILIRGEAGVGKTTLVREFLKRSSDGAYVLVGACDDLLTARPLGPFRDMARHEPALSESLEIGNTTALMEAVLDLMSRQLQPTVSVIEDIQWADEATLDVVRVVGRRIRDTSGLLLLTYRDGEVDAEHPLRSVMGALPSDSVMRIRLEGLSIEAVARLIADSALDPTDVFEVTGGNPFFTVEMASGDGTSVPASVQDSVIARVRRVSPESQELLRTLSVIPERRTNSEIERAVGQVDAWLSECERSGLLDARAGLVGFHHELIRRAIEASLTSSERVRANRQVLFSLPPGTDPARMAHHARQADDLSLLVRYAPAAARAARVVHSHHEAVSHYQSIEAHLDEFTASDRAQILADWAQSEHLLERHNEAIERITRAQNTYRSVGDAAGAARCGSFAVRLYELAKLSDEADRCMDEVIDDLEPLGLTNELAFATSQQAWLLMMRGDVRASVEADRAIDLAKQTGDEATLVNALNTKGVVSFWHGDDESGIAAFEEASTRAHDSGDAVEEVRALHNLTLSALSHQQLGYAHQTADRTCGTAARYMLPNLDRTAQTDLAIVLFYEGDWDAAENILEELLENGPGAVDFAQREVFLYLGRLQCRRGNPEGWGHLERSWSLMGRSGELMHMAEDAAAQAEHMWLTGRIDLDRTSRFSALLAELTSLQGNLAVDELMFWMWIMGEVQEVPIGITEPYRLVMDGEPAEAAKIWHNLGYPYERAIALAHGGTEDRLMALGLLNDLGAYAVAARLHESLREQGVVVPRLRRKTRPAGGLTARQTEVLALLAEQLTNAEIADRMFLSSRTVEHHVAAVMAKLAATTRAEAVSIATEQGLLAAG